MTKTNSDAPWTAERTAELLRRASLSSLGATWGASNLKRLNEECGVVGVFDPVGLAGGRPASARAAAGLHALQHRGQEAAGLAAFDGARIRAERHWGLVSDVFSDAGRLGALPGASAIGHTRYSTLGHHDARNIQPLSSETAGGGLAIAHNGHLTNGETLRAAYEAKGRLFQSTTDSELFLHAAAEATERNPIERFANGLRALEGAFAVVGLIGGTLIGARDPIGIRPLSIGRLEGGYALASETAALDLMGAQYVREVRPGEMVAIDGDGLRSIPFAEGPARARVCAFELIYFSRPDSLLGGRSVYQFRKRLGAELAAEAPVDADFVTPVPDTGAPAALGFSQALGAPLEYGLTRNDYAGRTFIEPDPDMRARRVREKHAANSALLKGRRVALIDDSLVRGVTARRVVEAVRAAGATEVHLRIACPPIRHPCYYGIDTPDAEELMAARRTPAEIAEEIGADSLAFLSIDGLYRAYGEKAGRGERPALTDHCFTGDYPTSLTDLSRREAAFPGLNAAGAAKEAERP